ncbi:MAG: riboflavin kinase [Alistipes sp.]|nr:riboflavin kinase [Alistipes sp.]
MAQGTEKVTVKGVVGSGRALGRRLGFPTANIYGVEDIRAVDGVYAVRAQVPGEGVLRGMANLGRRPTVDGGERVLEIHFFDYGKDLYGLEVQVELCKFIRPEINFGGTDGLAAQLREDEKTVRDFFENQQTL